MRSRGSAASAPPAVSRSQTCRRAERISDDESFAITRRLWHEEGLLVGGSSGTAVAAALRVASRPDIEGPVVAVLADGLDRYTSTAWFSS